ncbi:MAG: ATP-binding cassette domain-containing protein, partial [Lachnospiraceae bacterium]|nr:ATP-binding cassette domain-containing protein [Lachnospiraceae bacterium]
SGGQKQRVAIARALANKASILLCDEPTSALDSETTAAVLKLLKKINKELNITTVIITHELDVVKEICDRVVVMDAGKIVEEGEVYETFTNPSSEFTANLIKKDNKFKIPDNVLEHTKGKVVRIEYSNENAERSLIADVVDRFGVLVNIIHGRIEYIDEKPFGVLYIGVDGEYAQIRDALKYIEKNAGRMEVIRDVI